MSRDFPGHRAEERFRALAEASPAATFIAEGGRITYANPALASLTEYPLPDLLGMDPRQLLPRDERPPEDVRQPAWSGGGPVDGRYEVRLRTRTGLERWIDLTLAAFEFEGGAGVLGTGIDITDRKQLEDRMRRGLQLEAVGRLAGGVAHDFNNLLLVISGEAERLVEGLAGDEPLRLSAEAVARAAERAAALTQHLLAFGRQQMLIARPLDVNQVISELAPALAQDLGPDVQRVLDLAPALPAVRMDRDRLEQALLSVVSNAREAMGGRGQVTVSTDVVEPDAAMRRERPWLKAGRWVRLRVADNGPGMPGDVLARVFEPFFTTKREEGTGFGLSTVYGIIKQSGGYVWIESTPGEGACVTILLPPVEAPAVAASAPQAAPASRPHVLLVEDQDGIREMLTTMLEKQGFEVTAAASAELALELAPGVAFDLLLTDVVLPGIAGPELARRLREHAPRLRVLFMSGYTGDAFSAAGDLGDERSFIQKPFASKVLVERLRSLLETPPDGGAAPVSPFRGQ